MTRIAVVGGGPAATLHAEAVRMAASVELVGVGGRPGSAGPLAEALGVDDLPLPELAARADALIVAVPPADTAGVVAATADRVAALLVESPVATTIGRAVDLSSGTPVMTAVNLLHAPVVRRGIRAVAELRAPHHLELRARAPRPAWGAHGIPTFGGGAVVDPGARLLPILLAVAGSPVTTVTATLDHAGDGVDTRARLDLGLGDGRRARATLEWSGGDSRAQLEAADTDGVVLLDLLPRPALERNGRTESAPSSDEPALVALGFVDQVRRLAAVARREAAPWADLSTGVGALTVAVTAAASAAAGAAVRCQEAEFDRSPAARLVSA